MKRVVFRFGELRVAMETAEPGVGFRIEPAYRAFVDETPATPDCTLRWRVGAVSVPPGPPFAESLLWRVWRHDDGSEETVFFWGERIPYLSLIFASGFQSA